VYKRLGSCPIHPDDVDVIAPNGVIITDEEQRSVWPPGGKRFVGRAGATWREPSAIRIHQVDVGVGLVRKPMGDRNPGTVG
jgi:hypothetical protein